MKLTYSREKLIEKLKAKKTELVESQTKEAEKFRKEEIKRVENEISELNKHLDALKKGETRKDNYGRYYGRYYSGVDTTSLDRIIARLEMSEDVTVSFTDREMDSVFRFIL